VILKPGHLIEEIKTLYENGLPRGDSTGWKTLDGYYTVMRGQWTLVTGIPGHGKSEWLDALMVNLAKSKNWRFVVCSPENQPFETHVAKLAEKYIGKPFGLGPNPRMTEEELSDAGAWADAHFCFVKPEAWNLPEILAEGANMVKLSMSIGFVIDPWNELDHSRPASLTETEYVSQSLSQLRGFARDTNCHVWLVAHPRILHRDKDGKRPVPTPYDVSGSAHFFNKADNCVTIWRDVLEESQMVEVHVQKVRFKHIGKPGMVELRYDKVTGRYHDRHVESVPTNTEREYRFGAPR
jgi:twinkle protein